MPITPVKIAQYTEPQQIEPLLPQSRLDPLRERTRGVLEAAFRLAGAAHPATLARIRELVRTMNSYYSNRIEGQSTHPHNIEQALRHDFSEKPDIARLQRLALAHIEAEKALEEAARKGMPVLSGEFLRLAHQELYGRLSPEDRIAPRDLPVEPGEWRRDQVKVGIHEPPLWSALPQFLSRFDAVYSKRPPLEDVLFHVAAAHHRATWIHPFLDGNGRATRLQTHCALWPISGGLWSVNRGMARQRDAYYEHLHAADSHRQGDLDGRGNLSEKMLWAWCDWFVAVAEDQVGFMTRMLNLDEMKSRITALITFRGQFDKGLRSEVVAPLYHLYLAGPTPRGEFLQMTGLAERSARSALSRLIAVGLVQSAGHTAPVEMAFPLDALQFLLPELYPEAATKPT